LRPVPSDSAPPVRPRTWQELPLLDSRIARERALRCAIQTGSVCDLNLIHAIQRSAGHEPCFGRAADACPETHCRWHDSCMALLEFVPLAYAAGPVLRYRTEPEAGRGATPGGSESSATTDAAVRMLEAAPAS